MDFDQHIFKAYEMLSAADLTQHELANTDTGDMRLCMQTHTDIDTQK